MEETLLELASGDAGYPLLVMSLSAAVYILTELIKNTRLVDPKYTPLVAIALGIVLGVLAKPFVVYGFGLRAWAGFISALISTGVHENITIPGGDKKHD